MKTGNLYIPKTYFTNNGYRSLLKHDSPLGGPWLCVINTSFLKALLLT